MREMEESRWLPWFLLDWVDDDGALIKKGSPVEGEGFQENDDE